MQGAAAVTVHTPIGRWTYPSVSGTTSLVVWLVNVKPVSGGWNTLCQQLPAMT